MYKSGRITHRRCRFCAYLLPSRSDTLLPQDRTQGILFHHSAEGGSFEERATKAEWRATMLESEVERVELERVDALTQAA